MCPLFVFKYPRKFPHRSFTSFQPAACNRRARSSFGNFPSPGLFSCIRVSFLPRGSELRWQSCAPLWGECAHIRLMSLLVSKKRPYIGWTLASNGGSTKSPERLSQRKGAVPLPFVPAVRPPVAFLVALLLPVCQNFPCSHECAAPFFHLLPKRFQPLGGETVLRLGKQLVFFFFRDGA